MTEIHVPERPVLTDAASVTGALLDCVDDAILVLGPGLDIRYANHAAMAMTAAPSSSRTDCGPSTRKGVPVQRIAFHEITKDAIRKALHIHTASTRYLKALACADQRFDLDDQPAGEVTEEQRKQAQAEVKERIKKSIEKRKAEEAAKERQAKLEKLAEKFNAR